MDHAAQTVNLLPAGGGMRRDLLASGPGWRVVDVAYATGPEQGPLQDQHDLVTIAAVVAGNFQYRSVHGTELFAPGALLLGNPGSTYECGFEHSRGDRCISFNYTRECIEDILDGVPAARSAEFRVHRVPPSPRVLHLVANAAVHWVARENRSWEELAWAVAGDVFTLLSGDAPSVGRQTDRHERRIADVLHAIEVRHTELLSIGELAGIACMSPYHFMRVFRDAVGVTPYQHLLNTRLRHVAVELGSTGQPITSIAYAAGFGDISTFTAMFRRVFRQSPGQYRANVRRSAPGSRTMRPER